MSDAVSAAIRMSDIDRGSSIEIHWDRGGDCAAGRDARPGPDRADGAQHERLGQQLTDEAGPLGA